MSKFITLNSLPLLLDPGARNFSIYQHVPIASYKLKNIKELWLIVQHQFPFIVCFYPLICHYSIYVYFLIYTFSQTTTTTTWLFAAHTTTQKKTSNFASANRSMKKISVHTAQIFRCQENVWHNTQQQMRAGGRQTSTIESIFCEKWLCDFQYFHINCYTFWLSTSNDAGGDVAAGALWTFITSHYRVRCGRLMLADGCCNAPQVLRDKLFFLSYTTSDEPFKKTPSIDNKSYWISAKR